MAPERHPSKPRTEAGGFRQMDREEVEILAQDSENCRVGTTERIILGGYLFPEEEQGHVVPSKN